MAVGCCDIGGLLRQRPGHCLWWLYRPQASLLSIGSGVGSLLRTSSLSLVGCVSGRRDLVAFYEHIIHRMKENAEVEVVFVLTADVLIYSKPK